jgi:hypothetical protein
VSTKFQKSKDLLRIPLQFTCSKTSELPSILCAPLVATHSSLITSSVFLLVVYQTSVDLGSRLPRPFSWHSLLAPLRFMCSPSLEKLQFTIQLFGSANVIPKVFTIQSYLLFNVPILRHDTSLRQSMPLRTNLD